MSDKYNLDRFVEAQQATYARALSEIRRGHKQSHWMWFIFPQIARLGTGEQSRFYAIQSLGEAKAYLMHPILGPRLHLCTTTIGDLRGRSIRAALGSPDDDKLQSCMTLFAVAAPDRADFMQVLARHYDSQPDRKTLAILKGMQR